MGWTFTNKNQGVSVREFFEKEFNGKQGCVIDCAVKGYRTAYLAYECLNEDGTRKSVIGIVCLLGYKPHDYYNFGYKDMSEEMGPCESECPERILKLLTPTTYEWAQQWRDRCWENIKKRSTVKVKKGDKIKFKDEISFCSGAVLDTFTFLKGSTFMSGPYQSRYRITNWRNRLKKLIGKAFTRWQSIEKILGPRMKTYFKCSFCNTQILLKGKYSGHHQARDHVKNAHPLDFERLEKAEQEIRELYSKVNQQFGWALKPINML